MKNERDFKRFFAVILAAALMSGALTACGGGNNQNNSQSSTASSSIPQNSEQSTAESSTESKPKDEPAKPTKIDYAKFGTKVEGSNGLYKLNKDFGTSEGLNAYAVGDYVLFENYIQKSADGPYDLQFRLYSPTENKIVAEKTIVLNDYAMTTVYGDKIVLCDMTDKKIYIYNISLELLGSVQLGENFNNSFALSKDLTKLYYLVWDENYNTKSTIMAMDISDLSADEHEITEIETNMSQLSINLGVSDNAIIINGVDNNTYMKTQKYLSTEKNTLTDTDIETTLVNPIQIGTDGNYITSLSNDCIEIGKIGGEKSRLDCEFTEYFWNDNNNAIILGNDDYETNTKTYGYYSLVDGSKLSYISFTALGCISVPLFAYNAMMIVKIPNDGTQVEFYLWDLNETVESTDKLTVTKVDTKKDVVVTDWGNLKETHERAVALGEKYGVQICIGNECINQEGWGFQGPVVLDKTRIENALDQLETALKSYPEGFIQQLRFNNYKKIKISFVTALTSAVEGTISSAAAFVDLHDDYINVVFDVDQIRPADVYHELSHVIDSKLEFANQSNRMSYSETAWEALNPSDFNYISYTAYESYTSDEYYKYLYGESQYFVNNYSFTAPTEDRATILESVMEGDVFWDESSTQESGIYKKLRFYTKCIKEVFDMTGWSGNTLFEQVLSR
ncbi:MAG: hypothetical protein ACI4M3_02235 [Acutalibacteraceae bacterium]